MLPLPALRAAALPGDELAGLGIAGRLPLLPLTLSVLLLLSALPTPAVLLAATAPLASVPGALLAVLLSLASLRLLTLLAELALLTTPTLLAELTLLAALTLLVELSLPGFLVLLVELAALASLALLAPALPALLAPVEFFLSAATLAPALTPVPPVVAGPRAALLLAELLL